MEKKNLAFFEEILSKLSPSSTTHTLSFKCQSTLPRSLGT